MADTLLAQIQALKAESDRRARRVAEAEVLAWSATFAKSTSRPEIRVLGTAIKIEKCGSIDGAVLTDSDLADAIWRLVADACEKRAKEMAMAEVPRG